jgi:hypothetical protein
MLKVVDRDKISDDGVISMGNMKPLQIGVIVSDPYNGHIVMRTASTDRFELMDLTNPG